MILVGKSWVGQVRSRNEDVYWARPDIQSCGVADGMGGYDCGHVAARMTADAITQSLRETDANAVDDQKLIQYIKQANVDVHNRARELPDVSIMGSTVVLLYLIDSKGYICHVGDSRCYVLRESKLSQLTRDHSVVNQMIDSGELKPEEAEHSNVRNQVTQAIGPSMVVQPSVVEYEVQTRDLFMLCSDGLSGFVSNEAIEALMIEHKDNANLLLDRLINAAADSGSTDNITVVLAEIN